MTATTRRSTSPTSRAPTRSWSISALITIEFSEHEYRFNDIIDLDTREVLFTIEHETRSQTHPMFGRPLVNRNPAQSNRDYKPGHDEISWRFRNALVEWVSRKAA